MKIKPSIVITDLEEHLELYNIVLSEEARRTLMDVEDFAYRCDNPVNYNLFFSKVIRNSKIVKDILVDKGTNPNLVALVLEKDYYDTIDKLSNYEKEAYSYSQVYMRRSNGKTAIIDRALEYCVIENRSLLENSDILLAAMDEYERISDEDNVQWVDKELNKSYTTLSHVCGYYNKSLWIKFDDIREVLLNVNKIYKNAKIA
ncbi:MAG: hypothetical protein N4A68_03210 [Maledivibacter sp.]|jgi:hypothetical protein|nr:hypothetical protein [Maledivibacter sp.]